MRRVWPGLLAIAIAIVACGGRSADAPGIIIPPQPDGGAAASTPEDAGPPIAKKEKKKGPFADGPRDAAGMIGPPGKVVHDADAILLVNSGEIRVHPAHDTLARAITSVLVGWNLFMPVDLVDPIVDVDWVMMAGGLILGSTEKNVFLARYNLSEDRAEKVTKDLIARLQEGKKEPPPVGKSGALSAYVDRATRFYMRPQPGLLAIVPPAEAKADAEILAHADVAVHLRPKELLRVAWSGKRRGFSAYLPRTMTSLRLWIYATADDKLHLEGEGDCANDDLATEAALEIRRTLDDIAHRPFARMMAGKLLDTDAVWVDGKTVRYAADLDEAVIELVATAMGCPPSTPCTP